MDISYYKRRLKANKIKRQIMATRRTIQRVRVLCALVISICLCVFAIWALRLPQWYIDSAKFAAGDTSIIKIQGNQLTPSAKIIDMVKNTKIPYTQIYRLDTKPIEENITKLQPIKKVYIKRYWFPARLVIAVEERVPIFLLTPNLETEPNSALTAEGVLIDKEYLNFSSPQKAKSILTYGVKNGHDVVWDKKKVEKLIEITKAFEAYSGLEVRYIDLRNEKDSYIMLDDFLIRFGEINETALARIKWIAAIIPEAQKNKNNIKYIDLRWEDSRYFCLKNSSDTKEEAGEIQKQNENIKNETQQKKLDKNVDKKVIVKPSESEQETVQQIEVKQQENTNSEND
jgi:cell division septal protein FtsQ